MDYMYYIIDLSRMNVGEKGDYGSKFMLYLLK